MNTHPEKPRVDETLDPRLQAEWHRQEVARIAAAKAGTSHADDPAEDVLYGALARAAAAPPPALPADFAQRVQRRLQRADSGDRFEIALLGGVLAVGGVLALFFGLPVLANLAQPLELQLPEALAVGLHWALMGAATLALSGLVSGLIERRRNERG